jgi:hypothetical protein
LGEGWIVWFGDSGTIVALMWNMGGLCKWEDVVLLCCVGAGLTFDILVVQLWVGWVVYVLVGVVGGRLRCWNVI